MVASNEKKKCDSQSFQAKGPKGSTINQGLKIITKRFNICNVVVDQIIVV
jgi:hypothetical protein